MSREPKTDPDVDKKEKKPPSPTHFQGQVQGYRQNWARLTASLLKDGSRSPRWSTVALTDRMLILIPIGPTGLEMIRSI